MRDPKIEVPRRTLDAKEKRFLTWKQGAKKAKRLRDLEVLAGLEGVAALKPGQRVKRFVANLGKRFQHNVPTLD